jgi:hypothetical protein
MLNTRGSRRKLGASVYTRKRLSPRRILTHRLLSLRASYDVASNIHPRHVELTGARAKAWCLLVHAEASLSLSGQGESLVPLYTRGSISLPDAMFTPRFSSLMVSGDVASNFYHTLPP